MNIKYRTKRIYIALAVLLAAFMFAPETVNAGFSQEYTLGADAVENMIMIAEAQIGKKQAELGYKTAWCSYFIADCAKQAGLDHVITVRSSCADLYHALINAGAKTVDIPRRGDIVFYYCPMEQNPWVHAGIMLDSEMSVEGNYSGKVSHVENQYVDSHGHSVISGIVKRVYVRPDYYGKGVSGEDTKLPDQTVSDETKDETVSKPENPTDKYSKKYTGNYMVITKESPLAMRKSPKLDAVLIIQIPKNTIIKVTEADGTWAHVRWKNYNGYCSMQYLGLCFTTTKGYSYVQKDNQQVSFTGTEKKQSTVSIPGSVTYNGVKYQVTEISSRALKGLKKVKLGKMIRKMDKDALKDADPEVVFEVPKQKKKQYLKLLQQAGLGKKMKVKTY